METVKLVGELNLIVDATKRNTMAQEPKVVYAQLADSDDFEEPEDENAEILNGNEDSLILDMPVRRKRKLPADP